MSPSPSTEAPALPFLAGAIAWSLLIAATDLRQPNELVFSLCTFGWVGTDG
jgi:hypothetical protein